VDCHFLAQRSAQQRLVRVDFVFSTCHARTTDQWMPFYHFRNKTKAGELDDSGSPLFLS
jgi:hypothetical protein